MKSLKFAPHLVALTLSGDKTSTWRVFDDKDLQVGDELSFINRDTLEAFAQARITDVREKRLADITPEDQKGNGEWEPTPDRVRLFQKYYGNRVDENTIVKMITFELI